MSDGLGATLQMLLDRFDSDTAFEKIKIMPIDQKLNPILKEMWRIDEKRNNQENLTQEEAIFYSNNLFTIQEYYEKNAEYWKSKQLEM